jgi:nitrate reductase beta subunit
MTNTETPGTSETAAHQLGMVLDLNKCLGCQTCTVSCKKLWNRDSGTAYAYWNNVETHPGRGYPAEWPETGGRDGSGQVKQGQVPNLDSGYGRAWDFNHSETYASAGKPAAAKEWLRPEGDPRWGPNWDEDHGAGSYPENNHHFYLPRLCNHCTHAACLEACPRGAIEKDPEHGIVLVNQDICHGYRFCVEACPYKKVYFDPERQVTTKCIFCLPRIEAGVPMACARQCPGRIKVALPLHPEYGLEPNVFYVPPLSPPRLDARGRPTALPRIPTSYLESLFGEAVVPALATVRNERAKRRRGEPSELMDLLIAYDWHESFALGPGAREVL